MNYAVARLNLNNLDNSAQNLLAGAAIEPFAWHVTLYFLRECGGGDKLINWFSGMIKDMVIPFKI